MVQAEDRVEEVLRAWREEVMQQVKEKIERLEQQVIDGGNEILTTAAGKAQL